MTLYSLLLGLQLDHLDEVSCRIWCTDGSFLGPKGFIRSGKTALGYKVYEDTVACLKGSTRRMSLEDARKYCKDINGYLPSENDLLGLNRLKWTMYYDLSSARILSECNYISCGGVPSDLSIWNSWGYSNDVYMYSNMYVIPFFKVKL